MSEFRLDTFLNKAKAAEANGKWTFSVTVSSLKFAPKRLKVTKADSPLPCFCYIGCATKGKACAISRIIFFGSPKV